MKLQCDSNVFAENTNTHIFKTNDIIQNLITNSCSLQLRPYYSKISALNYGWFQSYDTLREN